MEKISTYRWQLMPEDAVYIEARCREELYYPLRLWRLSGDGIVSLMDGARILSANWSANRAGGYNYICGYADSLDGIRNFLTRSKALFAMFSQKGTADGMTYFAASPSECKAYSDDPGETLKYAFMRRTAGHYFRDSDELSACSPEQARAFLKAQSECMKRLYSREYARDMLFSMLGEKPDRSKKTDSMLERYKEEGGIFSEALAICKVEPSACPDIPDADVKVEEDIGMLIPTMDWDNILRPA